MKFIVFFYVERIGATHGSYELGRSGVSFIVGQTGQLIVSVRHAWYSRCDAIVLYFVSNVYCILLDIYVNFKNGNRISSRYTCPDGLCTADEILCNIFELATIVNILYYILFFIKRPTSTDCEVSTFAWAALLPPIT